MQSTLPTRLRPYMPTALIALIIVVWSVQFMTGDKGFFSQEARAKDLLAKEIQLAELRSQHKDLEARAYFLRTDNLSTDLLEERARIVLGFSTPNEYVIRDLPKEHKAQNNT